MKQQFQARWISKKRRDSLKRSGNLATAVLLDSFNGFLIVEPVGSNLGDGAILSREETDYEIRDAWCLDSRKRINEARRLLGLEELTKALVEVG